jgi:ribose transport system substrate-binding protein
MRKSLIAAALTAAALALTSCAMPADDPNFNASAAEVEPAEASAAAESQASLAAALQAPTSIGVDAPLPAAPAKGGTIVNLTLGTEYDKVFDDALTEAATVLGWKVENVPVSLADPTAAATAFDAAVAKAPAGIHIDGAFADALATNLPAAETAGIPVVCTGCSSTATGFADVSIDSTDQNVAWGQALATYVVTAGQSIGQDASVQIIPVPGGAVDDFNSAFNDSLSTQCRNCGATVSTLDPTVTDLTDPAAVTSFVVGELSTSMAGWALLDSGALSGGSADALATDPTLLAPVAVVGRGAAAADVAALQALGGAAAPVASGSAAASPSASPAASASPADSASPAASGDAGASIGMTPEQAATLQAWIAIPQPVMAWRVIDQFARLIGGGEPATGPLPSQLLTGANAADAVVDDNGNYIGIADYQDQFKALWGVK